MFELYYSENNKNEWSGYYRERQCHTTGFCRFRPSTPTWEGSIKIIADVFWALSSPAGLLLREERQCVFWSVV